MTLREELIAEYVATGESGWRNLTPREYVSFCLEFNMSREWRDSPAQYPDGTRTQAYCDEVNALWVRVWEEQEDDH